MNICGCLVHASNHSVDTVRDQINSLNGVEIHADGEDGRLVVVVEDTPEKVASELIMELHQIPGVISVTLTYHHFEDLTVSDTAANHAKSSQVGD
ncbi:chaperone NapD [Roseibium sp. HPY-6]|uniref:chaperone NapD n=1 Tax=Roseibium sp. HPY-6 TaxID=3229852 RepID=UPI00338F6626